MRFLLCLGLVALGTASSASEPDPLRDCEIESRGEAVAVTCGTTRLLVEDPATPQDAARLTKRLDELKRANLAGLAADRSSMKFMFMSLTRLRTLDADGRLTAVLTVSIGDKLLRVVECTATGVERPLPKRDSCGPLLDRVGLKGAGALGPVAISRETKPDASTPTSAPDEPVAKDAPGPALSGKTVVVFENEPPEQVQSAVLHALGPEPVIDASLIWLSLMTESALGLGNLDAARRPLGWPEELGRIWDDTIDACRIEAGGPPYGPRNAGAFRCGILATPALWYRFVTSRAARRVVHLRWLESGDQVRIIRLSGEIYAPDAETRSRLEVGVGRRETPAEAARALVTALVRGKGAKAARVVERDLPTAPPGSKPPSDAVSFELDPIAVPRECRLPKLELTPADDAFVRTVAMRWEKSAGTSTSSALRCRLDVAEKVLSGLIPGNTMMNYVATLTCGADAYRADTPSISLWRRSPQAALSADLLEQLVKASCP